MATVAHWAEHVLAIIGGLATIGALWIVGTIFFAWRDHMAEGED